MADIGGSDTNVV